ncbi:Tyrosine--tRNA ligase [compost metagenome]
MKLAHTLVRMYHGMDAAEGAQEHFVTVFQQRALPEDIEEIEVPAGELEDGSIKLIKLLTLIGFASSNGEAKRSIQQGAVKINEEKLTDVNAAIALAGGEVIQVGKRKFAKLLVR